MLKITRGRYPCRVEPFSPRVAVMATAKALLNLAARLAIVGTVSPMFAVLRVEPAVSD